MSDTIVHPYREGAAHRTTFGYRTADHPRLDVVQNGISAFCGAVSGLAIVAITVLTLAEVFSRSVLAAPLGWSVSFIELYLLPAAAFFGMVTAYRSGAHVAVVSVFHRLRPPVRKVLLIVGYAIVLAGMAAMGLPGLEATMFSISTAEAPVPGSSELEIPSWLWRAIVPFSMALGSVVVAIDLGRELTSSWSHTTTDYDPGDSADHALEEAEMLEEQMADEPKETVR